MAIPSASYSITVRLEVPPDPASVGRLTTAVGTAGGVVSALDVTESHTDRLVIDLTCSASDQAHAEAITQALQDLDRVTIRKVSDRTFLLHLGGKIEVRSKVPLRTRDDLSMAYTPGVARVCLAIAEHPEDARRLTVKRNSVAVVTDGSAVLGLGNLGPAAALPVMEGKAALFKRFADIDAWPICLDTQDVDEIVRTVQLLAPVFGGINLEDIAAPRCFEVERRLRDLLDVPVFHDDQHGTAIVVLAALTNALRVVGKELPQVRVVLSGAGAAGSAIARLLLHAPARTTSSSATSAGVVHTGRDDLDPNRVWLAENTNPDGRTGTPGRGPRRRRRLHRRQRARHPHRRRRRHDGRGRGRVRPGQPRPGGRPAARRAGRRRSSPPAAATSPTRSTTCWRSPGSSAGCSTPARATSTWRWSWPPRRPWPTSCGPDQLNPSFIVPSVFDPEVTTAVAAAVRRSVEEERAAGREPSPVPPTAPPPED